MNYRWKKRLKRYQRRLARCQRGSVNRAKTRVKVARTHARIGDARRDFLHKITTDLVRRFDLIAVEDLNVSGMVRNRSLARAISCTGWAEFRDMLDYKAQRYRRQVIAVDRWYPSSKTCSAWPNGARKGRSVLPVLRRPARPGHQRRQEHPCRRAGGRCL